MQWIGLFFEREDIVLKGLYPCEPIFLDGNPGEKSSGKLDRQDLCFLESEH